MRLSDFSVLTFDCYGTLIDWERGILNAVRPVLARHGRGDVADDTILECYADLEAAAESGSFRPYRDVLRDVATRLFDRFGVDSDDAGQNVLVDSLPNWPPFADTVEALRRLAMWYRLAIISNIDDDLFDGTARRLGVRFEHIATARAAGAYKPSLSVFEHAARQFGVERDRWLHVAQSRYHDIAPAQRFGLRCVWIDRRRGRGGGGATKPSDAVPDLALPDLRSFADTMGV